VKLCLYLSLDCPAFRIQRRDNHPQWATVFLVTRGMLLDHFATVLTSTTTTAAVLGNFSLRAF